MRVYKTPEIRNVAVVGHGASGKTSLVDALAFVAGTSKRHGSVKDGTALTDYTPDEIERKYSINLALAVAEWMDAKLNLIETPGYLDFTGEALAGVYAADGAVVVVSATGGVEVGTEKVWDYCEKRAIPRLFFVSLMDKEHADFEKVYRQVKERLTPKVIPVEIPVGEGPEFHGIINLFSKQCHMYKKGTKAGEYDEVDVPPEYRDRFERYSKELIERIAETDDTLLERYLGGEEIGRDEALAAMKAGMSKGELFPLFGGAAEQGEQLAFRHARLHRRERLVAPDLLAAQVALEQRIVRFGDALDQLLGIAFKPVPVLGRHVHLIVLAGLRALLVHVALLREEVDDPVELGTFADRDLHRDHLGCEPLFDLTVDLLEVGVLLVHQRDEEQPRDRPLLAVVPHLFGAHLHAARGGDDHDRSVRRVHARERLPREVEIARRVDQVELRVHPLGDRDGEIDGILAFDFIGGVIGESGTVLHGSVALARAGHEREGVDQGGLSARAVAHDRHVADLRCLVHAHGRMQLLLGVRRIWSTKQQAG